MHCYTVYMCVWVCVWGCIHIHPGSFMEDREQFMEFVLPIWVSKAELRSLDYVASTFYQ